MVAKFRTTVIESVCKSFKVRMTSASSGSAIDYILRDRAALEAHFGIHLDSDESDLDVPSSEGSDDDGKHQKKSSQQNLMP